MWLWPSGGRWPEGNSICSNVQFGNKTSIGEQADCAQKPVVSEMAMLRQQFKSGTHTSSGAAVVSDSEVA